MTERSRLRLVVVQVLVLSLLVTLLGRLWYLQVRSGPEYRAAAADSGLRQIVTQAARGNILDDQGRPLVSNSPALTVTVDGDALRQQSDGGTAVLTRLAASLHVPLVELRRQISPCAKGVPRPCWTGSPVQPVPITVGLDPAVSTAAALQVAERHEDFPGVQAEVSSIRRYPLPEGADATHLLGYTAPITERELAAYAAADRHLHRDDTVGRSGLEGTYDADLAGHPGVQTVSVDHRGRVTGMIGETEPAPGNDLVTSIDARAQAVVEQSLATAVKHARTLGYRARTAAGVVVDVTTGRVVAMASYPDYAPDAFVGGISQAEYANLTDSGNGTPLLNRALQGEYAPGSTFKLVTTSAEVTAGNADWNSRYFCPGGVSIGNRVFHNFEGQSLGVLNLHTVLVKSCDTIFYKFALHDWSTDQTRIADGQRPAEVVQQMALAYGLGHRTGIDLPSEASGLIETRQERKTTWRQDKATWCRDADQAPRGSYARRLGQEKCADGWRFHAADQALLNIGQGTVLVTPLQLAMAYAALANGGTVFSPKLAKAVVRPDGSVVRRITPTVRGHLPVSQDTLSRIRDALYDVPVWGTAASAFGGFPQSVVKVGGKTGTAQVQGNADTSWFASFGGPAGQAPRLAVVVMVPNGGQGAKTAAPAVRRIWEGIYGLAGGSKAWARDVPPKALPRTGAAPVTKAAGAARTGPVSLVTAAGAATADPPALPAARAPEPMTTRAGRTAERRGRRPRDGR